MSAPNSDDADRIGYDVWLDLTRAAERERLTWYREQQARFDKWKLSESSRTQSDLLAFEIATIERIRDFEIAFGNRCAAIDSRLPESEQFRPIEELAATAIDTNREPLAKRIL